jgi:cell division protease FtsH
LGRDFGHTRDYSEEIASWIDEEVRALIEGAHDEAWEILVQYRDVLDALVLELAERETLNKEDLDRILAPVRKRPPHNTFAGFGKRTPSDRPPIEIPETVRANGSSNGTAHGTPRPVPDPEPATMPGGFAYPPAPAPSYPPSGGNYPPSYPPSGGNYPPSGEQYPQGDQYPPQGHQQYPPQGEPYHPTEVLPPVRPDTDPRRPSGDD